MGYSRSQPILRCAQERAPQDDGWACGGM